MKANRATAAPELIWIGKKPFLISPPSARDSAFLYNFLGQLTEAPEDAPGDWLPDIRDEKSIEILESELGLGVLIFITTRRDHPEIRIDYAFQLSSELMERLENPNDDEIRLSTIDQIQQIALKRHRSSNEHDISHWKKHADPGEPFHTINLGKVFESEPLKSFGPEILSSWSIDQIENKLLGGEQDSQDFQKYGAPLSEADIVSYMQDMNDPYFMASIAIQRGEPIPDHIVPQLDPKWLEDALTPRVLPENLPELTKGTL